MRYIIILLITINLYSSDIFYYNFNKKIPLIESEQYLGIKTKYNFSIEGIKKQMANIKGISKIEEVKNIGSDLFLFKFSSKISDVEKILEKTSFVSYQIKGYHFKNKNSWPRFVNKQLIVKFKKNTPVSRIEVILKENDLYLKNKKNTNYNIFLILKTEQNINNILNLANKLNDLPEVEFAHPDFITIYKKFYAPNDTYFSDQWHHRAGTGGANSSDAWDINKGSKSIKIAIIDDGIDILHEDLNVIARKNFSTEGEDDGAEHGTACAGVAAAIGDNSKGMVGVCPNCSLISAKLLSENGAIYPSAISQAFRWSVLMGADVISNSWGASEPVPVSEELRNTINYATANGRKGKGSIILFAVGNDSRELYSYETSSLINVIGVGASDYQDKKATYSNFGDYLTVVAPSSAGTSLSYYIPEGNIWTTDRTGVYGYNRGSANDVDTLGNYTRYFGGTSSATPLVSGMAGLILSEAPNLTYLQVIDIIKTTANKIGGSNEYDNNGYSTNFGYGKVDVKQALLQAQVLSTCLPEVNGEICDNNKDDDCDGFIDASDSDCNNYNPCSEYQCTEHSKCVFDDTFNPERNEGVSISCECDLGYKKQNNGLCVLDSEFNPCENITCSNHGVCEVVEITDVKCNCDSGYHNEGETSMICRKDDSCTGIECQENAYCNTDDALCHCKRGYYDEGDSCLKYDEGSLCESSMCFENAKCDNSDGECYCNNGYEMDDSNKCVKAPEKKPESDNKNTDDSSCSYSRGNESVSYLFFMIFFFLYFFRKKVIKKRR